MNTCCILSAEPNPGVTHGNKKWPNVQGPRSQNRSRLPFHHCRPGPECLLGAWHASEYHGCTWKELTSRRQGFCGSFPPRLLGGSEPPHLGILEAGVSELAAQGLRSGRCTFRLGGGRAVVPLLLEASTHPPPTAPLEKVLCSSSSLHLLP